MKKSNLTYQGVHRILALLFFIACSLIVFYSQELGELRGFIGDIVIIMLLYSLAQGIHRFTPWKLAISIVIFSYIIEFLQYLHFGTLMGWESNQFARLIFGSIYDPLDLLAYTIGGVCIYLIDILGYCKKYKLHN